MCSCSDNNQTGQNASTELPVNLTIYQLNRINSDPKIYHFFTDFGLSRKLEMSNRFCMRIKGLNKLGSTDQKVRLLTPSYS